MHTLYATSFLIYFFNSLFNWIYTYFILKGDLTSFPLKLWYIVGLVIVAVTGSMLCILLIVLFFFNIYFYLKIFIFYLKLIYKQLIIL